MSHLLIGLAICAALLIYPGGVCLVGAWLLVLGGTRLVHRRPKITAVPWPDRRPPDWLLAGFLSALVVVPLSWPANPIGQISAAGLSGLGMGGIALTLAGLWSLGWIGPDRLRSTRAVPGLLAWSVGLIILATIMRAPGWGELLGSADLAQKLLRGGLGVVALLALPWFAGPFPERDLFTAAAWAAWLAVAFSLLFPALQSLQFPVVLGSWWAGSLAAGLISALGASWRSRWIGTHRRGAATGCDW